MDDGDERIFASPETRRSNLDREGDGSGGARPSVDVRGTGRTGISGNPESSHSDSDSDDSDQLSDVDPSPRTTSRGGSALDRRVGGPVVISAQDRVSVLSFGTINLEGTTSSVEIGNRTEYLGSVTVQQIVHGDPRRASSPEVGGSLGAARARGRPAASMEVGPDGFVPRRTGLVLSGRSVGIGVGETCGKKAGDVMLWKHLLGRKVETATWIPIVLLSIITVIAITIHSFIFARYHHGRDTELASLQRHISQPLENTSCLPRTKRNREALPKLHRSVIIPRSMWFANPPKEFTQMEHPVEYVIISHTATEPCDNQAECSMQVRLVQRYHVDSRNWSDIGYNFLVGGDGNAYEGRGWEYVGAHAKGYNVVSIGISFIGTFSDVLPPPAQIRACKLLIKEGVSLGKIASNYKLIGHRQVSPTESPGEKLYEELQKWEHWSPVV